MIKVKIFFVALLLIVLLPLWLWLAWLLTPKTRLVAAIVDKTVPTAEGQEHLSLTWLLNHNRYSKTSTSMYSSVNDYFGFFPKENQEYKLKGLERFSDEQLQKLSQDADMAYFTDTYGVYATEWYSGTQNDGRSGVIYGGLSNQDLKLLQLMKAKQKLIITEFNTIGSPTAPYIRKKFESMFGLHWTGWTARFFSNLDTLNNDELPRWLVNNYKKTHSGKWPFKRAGLAFVNDDGGAVVLEEGTHLTDAMSYIESTEASRKAFDVPKKVPYPFWFDVIVPDTRINSIAATFEIRTNAQGQEEMKSNGLPAVIPAMIYHKGTDYNFYYFSGDFCDNKVSMAASYFKGIGLFKAFFYESSNQQDRSRFFWEFYKPMMERVLENR